MNQVQRWIQSGAPYIWLNAAAVSICLIMVIGLVLFIAWRGLGHFWPAAVIEFRHIDESGVAQTVIGEIADQETVLQASHGQDDTQPEPRYLTRILIKTGNRDYLGTDFHWYDMEGITAQGYPPQIMVVERREWGNLYGYLAGFKTGDRQETAPADPWRRLQAQIAVANHIFKQIREIEKDEIGAINFRMEKLRHEERALELAGQLDLEARGKLEAERSMYGEGYNRLTVKLKALYQDLNQYTITVRLGDGTEIDLPLAKVVRAYQPNNMSWFAKTGFYLEKLWEYVSDEPREANTEGGIFPAIFGTVLMVLIMAVLVTPIGVVTAIYLHEYAKQGLLTRAIRIAVNNLAGVPSVVYGVFGLGFFVYFLGGSLDQLFFPEALPAPTFGTPGLLWASLTLSILTVPVVIVSTEEGLSRVPRDLREGSLALGATKAETLWRTVLPMTASSMMTGLILAIARAAGEVAPLMLVGVVKLAPSLPLDGNFPFLHLDRKFMHLGFHIYDVGFQSPNVEAARPLVYATAFLLVLIVIVLNLAAIHIRNHLREKYRTAEH